MTGVIVLQRKFGFGSGRSDDPSSCLARPFRRLAESGHPPGQVSFLIIEIAGHPNVGREDQDLLVQVVECVCSLGHLTLWCCDATM